MRYLFGFFILIWAAINGRHIRRWLQDGEAYLVMSVSGDGLLGRANRADEPMQFWFNIVVQCLIVVCVVAFGFWLVLKGPEF